MHGFPRAFHLAPPCPASRHLGHAAFTAFTAFAAAAAAAAFSTVSTAFQHGPTRTHTRIHAHMCAKGAWLARGGRTTAKQQARTSKQRDTNTEKWLRKMHGKIANRQR